MNFFKCTSEDLLACVNILYRVETRYKVYKDGACDDEGDGFCEDGVDESGQVLCEEGGVRGGGIDLVEERCVCREPCCLGLDAIDLYKVRACLFSLGG